MPDDDLRLWLLAAEKPDAIAMLEAELGVTQSELVDQFIERTCWSRDLPEFVGHQGTPEERLEALRAVMRACPIMWDVFSPHRHS